MSSNHRLRKMKENSHVWEWVLACNRMEVTICKKCGLARLVDADTRLCVTNYDFEYCKKGSGQLYLDFDIERS